MNQVDRFFASQLAGYRVEPSRQANQEIETIISKSKGQRTRVWISIAASVSLVFFVGWSLMVQWGDSPVVENSEDNLGSITTPQPPLGANDQQMTKQSPEQGSQGPMLPIGQPQVVANRPASEKISTINRKPVQQLFSMVPGGVEVTKQARLEPVQESLEKVNPTVTIIYKRGRSSPQTVTQVDTEEPSRLQKWLSKARDWREKDMALPGLGDLTEELFAKDSKKSDSKSQLE